MKLRSYLLKNYFKSGVSGILLLVFSIFFIGVGVGIVYVSHFAVKVTSNEDFCISCHTMRPMVESYRDSLHGNRNRTGVKAECVDCHLPSSNNIVYYLYSKTKTGLHDIYAQTFYDLDKIDWHANRKRREEFTYDSGCLNCHGNLRNVGAKNRKAFRAHREYFSGSTDKKCVSCHENVGHKNLKKYIKHFNEDFKGEYK